MTKTTITMQLMRLLSKERIVAPAYYNRWLIPPIVLISQFFLGLAGSFYVLMLWLLQPPLYLPHTKSEVLNSDWIFTFDIIELLQCIQARGYLSFNILLPLIVCLLTAWVFAGWVEQAGPRKATLLAAFICFIAILLLAMAIYISIFWLIILACGIVGWIGLTVAFVAPISTLAKWFPEQRAKILGSIFITLLLGIIIGFPLTIELIRYFIDPTGLALVWALIVLAIIFALILAGCAFVYRVPTDHWLLLRQILLNKTKNNKISMQQGHVHLHKVGKTVQFWGLCWISLVLISMHTFALKTIVFIVDRAEITLHYYPVWQNLVVNLTDLNQQILSILPLMSELVVCQLIGGILVTGLIDKYGHKTIYSFCLALLLILNVSLLGLLQIAYIDAVTIVLLFILGLCAGCLMALPAYCADLFGLHMLGAIYTRLLTAVVAAFISAILIMPWLTLDASVLLQMDAQFSILFIFFLICIVLLGLTINLNMHVVHTKHLMTEQDIRAHFSYSTIRQYSIDIDSIYQDIRPQHWYRHLILILSWALLCILVFLSVYWLLSLM